jgi:hypothetical protein
MQVLWRTAGVNVSQGAAGTAAGSGESEEEEWQGSWRR